MWCSLHAVFCIFYIYICRLVGLYVLCAFGQLGKSWILGLQLQAFPWLRCISLVLVKLLERKETNKQTFQLKPSFRSLRLVWALSLPLLDRTVGVQVQALGSVKRLETIVLFWCYINQIELNWRSDSERMGENDGERSQHPVCGVWCQRCDTARKRRVSTTQYFRRWTENLAFVF